MLDEPPPLLRTARFMAGLSQRALAARAGTTQSVVARIERGEVSPTWGTMVKLLAAAGFRLDTQLTELPGVDTHMLDDVPRLLALTPEQRLAEVRNADRFLKAVHRA